MLRDLKRELNETSEQYEKVKLKASKLETECKDSSQGLENMTRDFNELSLRLKTYEGSIEASQKLNEEYRDLLHQNENIVAQQAAEVKDIILKLEVNKVQLDRVRDENQALKRQNEKLTEDLKEKSMLASATQEMNKTNVSSVSKKDALQTATEQFQFKERELVKQKNELMEKVARLEDEVEYLKQQRPNAQSITDLQTQLKFSRQAFNQIKEDYDQQMEKSLKQHQMQEQIIAGFKKELLDNQEKSKELQDFFNRYDTIIQQERKANFESIKEINERKEEIERNLKKQLDNTTSELETLKSEFNVKMQRIKLMELELDNKLSAEAANKKLQAEAMHAMEIELEKLRKGKLKFNNKMDELRKDLQLEKDGRREDNMENREIVNELKEKIIKINAELQY